MIGTVFLIIAAIFVYRTAKQNGYRAIVWTIVSVAVFFGVQVLVAVTYTVIILLAAGEEAFDEVFDKFSSVVGIASMIAGAGGMLIVLRHVNKIREEPLADKPPSPSTFGLGE